MGRESNPRGLSGLNGFPPTVLRSILSLEDIVRRAERSPYLLAVGVDLLDGGREVGNERRGSGERGRVGRR